MSINKLISIKIPILDAFDQLGIQDNFQETPWFTRLATMAEREISSYFQFKKQRAVIDIKGCTACLPSNARNVQRAILGDLGCDCADLFNTLCSQIQISTVTSSALSTFLIIDMGTNYTTILGSIPHVVQDNKIILEQNLDGQKLTIQYLGEEVDEDGFIKVGQNHVQAIVCFIKYHYHLRRLSKPGANYIHRDLMSEAKQEWHRECSNSRAKDNELTESEREEINCMLSDPYIGRGLEVGMRTTLSGYMW